MSGKLVILNNPLIFMTESFVKKNILKDKYSSVEPKYIYENEVIRKICFKFKEENLLESFLQEYNDKNITKFNYKLQFEKTDKKIEDIEIETNKNAAKLEPYKFADLYEDEWRKNYSNSPDKPGLLYINEEGKQIAYRLLKYLVEKFGKNILQGNSILNISLPVFMFDTRTLQEAFAYEEKFAPIYLTKAVFSEDKIERLKWVTTYLMSYLHISVIQLKPFNPLIGETFQCRIGNMNIYVEHTVNHPITYNFYIFDDEKNFTVYGYLIIDASLSPNSVFNSRLGEYYIKFKDGTTYYLQIPNIIIKGTAMGERTFNYTDKCVVMDLTNGLCSYMEMNPNELGFIQSFFKSKKTFPDFFSGKIVESKYVTVDKKGGKHQIQKNAETLSVIKGEWTSYISFDDVEYWNIEDDKGFSLYYQPYTLPSNGSYRKDLLLLSEGNQEQSQIEKEKYEVRQRQDRKLRADYAKQEKQ